MYYNLYSHVFSYFCISVSFMKDFEKFKDHVSNRRQKSRMKNVNYVSSNESDNPTAESHVPDSPNLSSFSINLDDTCRRRSSARAQVFGYHSTVRAQGLLGNTKWACGPYRRWSRHPDESRDTLYSNWIPRRFPEAVIRDRGRKLGMGFWNAHPTLRLASVCVLCFITFNYKIISLFTCKLQFPLNNSQILQLSPDLHISPISCFLPCT